MFQVILRRTDGELNFFRPWESYKKGFGDKKGEHWLGECFVMFWAKKEKTMNNQAHEILDM